MQIKNALLIVFCFQTVVNLTRPVITLYADELGASTFEIGILTAMYAFFPLIIAIQAGKMTDKIGNRIPVVFGLLGLMSSMAIPVMFESMWALYASQLLVGGSVIFITVSIQNILGSKATDQTRDYYFSLFGLAVAMGAFTGPIIGGYLVEHVSYNASFLVSILFCAASFLLAFFLPAAKKEASFQEIHVRSSLQLVQHPLVRKALFSSALVLYSRDILVAYFPLFGKEAGLSASAIGWVLSIQGLAMIVIRFILPWLLRKMNRDVVLSVSIIVAGIAFLLIPFTNHIVLLCLLSCFMGFGLGCGQPISLTTTYNVSPANRTGEVLGIRLTTNRLSQLVAPLFFGLVGTWIGVTSVFFVSGFFLIGGAFLVAPRQREKVS